MTTALTRLPDASFELTLTVPWADVKKIYDRVFDELAAEIEVEGFRKGKAPKVVIDAKIDRSKIYGQVVNRLLPDSYAQALAEHSLKPIVNPRVQIKQAEEEKDWQFIASACEKPQVNLDKYQEAVKAINAKGKIWTPDRQEADTKETPEEKTKKINELIDKLLEVCQVDIAELLLESEANRLISQLINDVRSAGLTYEQYLASSAQTAEKIKEKYRQQAQSTLKLEFILEAVADDLKIEVSEAQLQAVIDKETDREKKETLQKESYLLASLLRRENTLTKLMIL